MTQTKSDSGTNNGKPLANCNVSMKYNFIMGGIAIATALLIGYFAYVYW